MILFYFATFAHGAEQLLSGGVCEYKEYKGYATISSITIKNDSRKKSHEQYIVKFSFTSETEVKEKYARTEGKQFVLLLANSGYPGQKYLEKYGIHVGKIFDCTMKVIIGGTCTPVLFEFPNIKLDDYREK